MLVKFNDSQHGYLRIELQKDKILGSYIAVDDPTSTGGLPTKPPGQFDEFSIPVQ